MYKRRTPTPKQRRSFGNIIRDEQKICGLTQEDLADILDCSPHWITNIECGKSDPTWLDALRLIRALKLDVEEILEVVDGNVPVSSN